MTAPAPERLAELLAAVEMAEGPSRELDADLFIVTTPGILNAGRIDRDFGVVGWWPRDACYQSAREVPHYTSSVDEALALVERMLPGVRVRMGFEPDGEPDGANWFARIDGPDFYSAKLLPLAILAALIRALITGAHHAD